MKTVTEFDSEWSVELPRNTIARELGRIHVADEEAFRLFKRKMAVALRRHWANGDWTRNRDYFRYLARECFRYADACMANYRDTYRAVLRGNF